MSNYDAMAGYIYRLDADLVSENAPYSFKHLLELLEEHELSTDNIAMFCDCAEWHGVSEDVTDTVLDVIELALKVVKMDVLNATGLEVTMTYVDEATASSYNEVAGAVWCVLNATQATPPAEQYKEHITQQFFCHFG